MNTRKKCVNAKFLKGSRVMLVSATDPRTYHLLYQWMIVANVQKAKITKFFQVYLQSSGNQTIVSPFIMHFPLASQKCFKYSYQFQVLI